MTTTKKPPKGKDKPAPKAPKPAAEPKPRPSDGALPKEEPSRLEKIGSALYAHEDATKVESEFLEVDPKMLVRREINARFMEPGQFRRLVENLQRDGKLTSVPLVYKHDDGMLEIISGHHRIEASVECAFPTITVEAIVSRHTQQRLTALQLSHNAISGQDNKSVLAEMYNNLDLDWKKYSGLTDDDIGGFDKIKIDGLGGASLEYEEIAVLFLPEDKTALERAIETLKDRAAKKRQTVHVGRLSDFDKLFDAIVKTKVKMNVHNSALAILTMAELALERLAQIEAEEQDGQGKDAA